VRLAGLYALERLANSNRDQRQTIVNVICAYLQMPFSPPALPPAKESDDVSSVEQYKIELQEYEQRLRENRIRKTAEEILYRHLQRLDEESTRWAVATVDLSGSSLVRAQFVDVHFGSANLAEVDFTHANLSGASLAGADMRGANLTSANLRDADLRGGQIVRRCARRRDVGRCPIEFTDGLATGL
jgi:uncharacterized protein YjbI with pentapeptide repeats